MLIIPSKLKKWLAAAALSFGSVVVLSEEMTVENFIEMDLQARQITLEGVKARYSLLQSGAELDVQLRHDAQVQEDVEIVYVLADTTPSRAVAWASRHSEVIKNWLKDNPKIQEQYDLIERELSLVSERIQALANQ